jgi:hypothetical protein
MAMSKAKATPCAALKGADESAAFRNELRGAREVCARDAEAFDEVLFVVERLGCRLSGRIGDLDLTNGACQNSLRGRSWSPILPTGEVCFPLTSTYMEVGHPDRRSTLLSGNGQKTRLLEKWESTQPLGIVSE